MSAPTASPGGRFTLRRTASDADIDDFGHVNNERYIGWAMEAAWAHSEALGFAFEDFLRIGVGCVVARHEADYLAPVLPGETVEIATWIAENDGRLRMARQFETTRLADGAAVFRCRTVFVCVRMDTGRPARMPAAFIDAYRAAQPG